MGLPAGKPGTADENPVSIHENENIQLSVSSDQGEDDQDFLEVCRVCHCTEPDNKGEAALQFLGISPPLIKRSHSFSVKSLSVKGDKQCVPSHSCSEKEKEETLEYVKYVSPDGEVLLCDKDLEEGLGFNHNDYLIELGCHCKNELALGHYACLLRWFVSHGSIHCEICGSEAVNVRLADVNKVKASVEEYESLRARTAAGEVTSACIQLNPSVDPDAAAAVRRQRLTEIASWFNPRLHTATVSQSTTDEVYNAPIGDLRPNMHPRAKWVVEGTGILIATGLLTVTLAWLIAPRVGKKTAKSGLHILLGGLCALTVVVFLRFAVLPRIRYGRARYWAIVFVFMFLVFGIWASRTRATRSG
ncbi:uncharacterized protein LOC131054614 isoform X1 [Cryptomeria japonica]|uniref:uncharacterized protein LOC131054614 isoform X1 n=1 Tax=Cryptomeria japonica TaxID=3369 RepID=UPI0027DAACED|nr:uncharacterized protein LOC131054614 isoform X1 [Cryptomeria japonica]XP_057845141.2 uncharacterized protein LOC131054614 isoform X1 [Cryptomeria japonica]